MLRDLDGVHNKNQNMQKYQFNASYYQDKNKKYDVFKKVILCKELQDGLKFRRRQVLLNLEMME